MKKLTLIALAIFAASAQAKVTCSIVQTSRGQALATDFEVNMRDARQHSHNNEVGVLLIDEKGKVSNLESEMSGEDAIKALNGKTIIMVERAKVGMDILKIAKGNGKKDSLDGIINQQAGNSAIGNLEPVGLGMTSSSLDLMGFCKLSK